MNAGTNDITSPALLQSIHPYPICLSHAKDLNVMLQLTSCKNNLSTPDIESLSLMPIHGDQEEKEFVIKQIQALHQIGIKDRLQDALESCNIKGYERCSIEVFLRRSEAVFREVILSIEQVGRSISETNEVTKIRSRGCKNLPTAAYYLSLVSQVDAIGWQHVNLIDDSLSRIIFEVEDKMKRKHELICELDKDFPIKPPICTTDLPGEFDSGYWRYLSIPEKNKGAQSSCGLFHIYKSFRDSIDSYQLLWDELDDIDKHCFILEPSLPARRSVIERRIALHSSSGGLSVVINLDPKRPRGVPISTRFIGGTKLTNDLRSKFNSYIVGDFVLDEGKGKLRWTENLSIRENLEVFLGALPSPINSDKAEFILECGICYANRLEEGGALPDASCGNKCCARSYHESCLFEWLHSLPTARISFDRIFGTCPYCLDTISVATSKSS